MNVISSIVLAVTLPFFSTGISLAQVTSSESGFPGGSTGLFSSEENPSLRSPFGTSTTSPTTQPSLGTAGEGALSGIPQGIGGTNPNQAPGITNQGIVTGTPGALGGTGQPATGLGSSTPSAAPAGSIGATGQSGGTAGAATGGSAGTASSAASSGAASGR